MLQLGNHVRSFHPEEALMLAEELLYRGEPFVDALRLLCLASVTHNGIPRKFYDNIRKECLQTYGYEHILTLDTLHAAGMLKRQDTRSNFPGETLLHNFICGSETIECFLLCVEQGRLT